MPVTHTERTTEALSNASVTIDTPFVAARVESSQELVLFEDSNLAESKISHR